MTRLAISAYLWHKTAVPLFVERFILVVLAAIFVAVAITNPMQLDKTQRVTASLAVVFLAYLVAHTIYKQIHTPPPIFFDAEVLQTLVLNGPDHYWIADEARKVVSPVDLYLLVRLTSLDDSPLIVDGFYLDVKGKNGWIKLTILSDNTSSWKFVTGQSLKAAYAVTTEPSDIWTLFDKAFGPKEPRSGIALCEFKSPPDVPDGPLRFRVSVLDAKRRLSVIETDLPDPNVQTVWSKMERHEAIDLSSFIEKRW